MRCDLIGIFSGLIPGVIGLDTVLPTALQTVLPTYRLTGCIVFCFSQPLYAILTPYSPYSLLSCSTVLSKLTQTAFRNKALSGELPGVRKASW